MITLLHLGRYLAVASQGSIVQAPTGGQHPADCPCRNSCHLPQTTATSHLHSRTQPISLESTVIHHCKPRFCMQRLAAYGAPQQQQLVRQELPPAPRCIVSSLACCHLLGHIWIQVTQHLFRHKPVLIRPRQECFKYLLHAVAAARHQPAPACTTVHGQTR